MASLTFPGWLSEICFRLESGDESLENLNLNIRRMDANMMKKLARALIRNSKHLLKLNLTSAVVSDPANALRPLMMEALPVTSSLQVLHLSYNNITCAHIQAMDLELCLSTNCSLRELYLDYNAVGADGAAAIARGMMNNKTLQVLQLNNNCIGNDGVTAITSTLKTRSPLRIIGLRGNRINHHGFDSLRRVLEHSNNYLLQDCLISGNDDLNGEEEQSREWVEMYCHANRIGRSIVAQKGSSSLFPIILSQASSPSTPTMRSLGVVYLIIRNHLYT
mmetsp:Transcript_8066/g.22393  ORF Transcript_8066/g.22393 Transcript_8066/m.22393 type:complete len:277 (-) Transcript_8066:1168-1998(-)